MIGLERKRIGDLVQSVRERRLSGHQLPGLMNCYSYVYLVVEGIFRPSDRGELEERRGQGWRGMGVRYREINNHLATLEMMCGVVVRRTSTAQETATLIVDLYKWWSEKEWAKHKSHCQIYAPDPASMVTSRKAQWVSPEERIRRKYGEKGVVCWRQAAQLPGVDSIAELVVEEFRSPGVMAAATVKQWEKIPGIGKTLAKRFYELYRD
jgi:ERCC4-type nuclease